MPKPPKYTVSVSYNAVHPEEAESRRGEFDMGLAVAPDELPRDYFRESVLRREQIPMADWNGYTVWFAVLIILINGLPLMPMPQTRDPHGRHA